MNINEPVSVNLLCFNFEPVSSHVFATHHQSLQLSTARRLIEKGHPQDPNLSVYCCLIVCRAESHHAHLLLLSLLGIYVNAKNVPDTRNLAGGKGEANYCLFQAFNFLLDSPRPCPLQKLFEHTPFWVSPSISPCSFNWTKKCSKWTVPGGQVSQRQ